MAVLGGAVGEHHMVTCGEKKKAGAQGWPTWPRRGPLGRREEVYSRPASSQPPGPKPAMMWASPTCSPLPPSTPSSLHTTLL